MKTLILTLFLATTLIANNHFIEYKVDGKVYQAYYSSPSKNAPLVYMVHDWDGITDYEIKRATMLNKLGYSVFAVDLYGKGIRPTDIKEKKRLTQSFYNNRTKMRQLLNAGLTKAKELGANINNAVALGYCFGGSAVLEMARNNYTLKSFISFHGGLNTPSNQNYNDTKGEVVIFHGTADKIIPMQEFSALAIELEKANINHEMITYGGAKHAFSVLGSSRYHKKADQKSWLRLKDILKTTLQ